MNECTAAVSLCSGIISISMKLDQLYWSLCSVKGLVSFYDEFVYLMHMPGGLQFCSYKNDWEFRVAE